MEKQQCLTDKEAIDEAVIEGMFNYFKNLPILYKREDVKGYLETADKDTEEFVESIKIAINKYKELLELSKIKREE